ncbi:MAG: CocE/NonD family hydrolase, partial [Mycobacteriales bacterium]
MAIHRDLYRWPGRARRPADEGRLAELFPSYRAWTAPAGSDYWRPIDVTRAFHRLDVAGYHVAGWYDIFCEGSLAAYTGMTNTAGTEYARRSQRLVVGPWIHSAVYFPSTPEVDFGPAANGVLRGIPAELLQFLRQAAERREVPAGASVFVMGRGRWLELSHWPPEAVDTDWYLTASAGAGSLAGDGRLTPTPAEFSGTDRYRHDPADPVPTQGGRTLSPGLPGPGPMDQREVERRSDVLVYTSAPLTRELTVVGAVRAALRFASSAPVADLAVKLVDVHPDGTALGVVDSVRRVSCPTNRARLVEVTLGSIAMTFRPGHRIRVEVASANFPRFDACPGGEQSVHHGGRSGSRVILPVFQLS